DRDRGHHPGRLVRAVDGAAHHAGHAEPGAGEDRGDAARHLRAGDGRRRPADRAPAAARLLPEAGHRRHQPRGHGDVLPARDDLPHPDGRSGRRQVTLADDAIHFPHLNYAALAPMLILFGAAALGVLVEAFLPRGRRYLVQLPLSVVALVAALVWVVREAGVR